MVTPSNLVTPGQFSVNGQRAGSNYLTVDGVSANFGSTASTTLYETAGGGVPAYSSQGSTASLASVDAVQEFTKGIEIAKKVAARRNLKFNGVASDFAVFEVGKQRWDLIVGAYMGELITSQAARLVEGLRPNGLLVVENFHRDINVNAITGGKLGYPVNALLETFVPKLRIVRYEEALDFPDWTNRGEKVPLVRLLARKG